MNGTDPQSIISVARTRANSFLEDLEDANAKASQKNLQNDKFYKLYDIASRRVAIHNKQTEIMRDIFECDKLDGCSADAGSDAFETAFDQYCAYLRQVRSAIAATQEYLN